MRVRGLRSVSARANGRCRGNSEPSTQGPKSRLMAVLSNSGASRSVFRGNQWPAFSIVLRAEDGRSGAPARRLVQAVAEPLHRGVHGRDQFSAGDGQVMVRLRDAACCVSRAPTRPRLRQRERPQPSAGGDGRAARPAIPWRRRRTTTVPERRGCRSHE